MHLKLQLLADWEVHWGVKDGWCVISLKAAGGVAAGVSIKHTLVKECQEEACIPEALAAKAVPVSTVR